MELVNEYELIEGSRATMLDQLTMDTPFQVISEVAESMGYKVDTSLTSDNYIEGLSDGINDYLSRSDKISISINSETLEPKNEENNLSKVAKLVNSDEHNWTIVTLNAAFRHLLSFFMTSKIHVSRDFEVGRKTPENPELYDACILYRICSHLNIPTTRHMTMDTMATIIRLYKTPRAELVNRVMNMSHRETYKPNPGEIKKTYNSLFKNGPILPIFLAKYRPVNNEEAIAFAKNRYSINLDRAFSPHDEYIHMTSYMTGPSDTYIPRDPNMKHLVFRDKSWIIGNSTWLPSTLSASSHVKLREFVQEEGFTHSIDLKDPHTSLGDLGDKNHIYWGIHPYLELSKITTLIYRETVKTADDLRNIVTIGKTNNPETLYVTTLDELTSFFSSNSGFCLPDSPCYYFNDVTINKLVVYCDRYIENAQETGVRDYAHVIALKTTISTIKQIENDVHIHTDKIRNLGDEDKALVEKYLIMMRDLAYYMRGWKVGGNTDVPLISDNTQSEETELSIIETNYSNQLMKIQEVYGSCVNELNDIIDGIFLMLKMDKDGKAVFIKSCSDDVGKTLQDRLMIISNNDDDNACIRLSSNYILYTVWYYYNECFDVSLFDIDDVSFIS